jgi:hypothetical protein
VDYYTSWPHARPDGWVRAAGKPRSSRQTAPAATHGTATWVEYVSLLPDLQNSTPPDHLLPAVHRAAPPLFLRLSVGAPAFDPAAGADRGSRSELKRKSSVDGAVRGDPGHRVRELRSGQAGPGRQHQGSLRRQVHRERVQGTVIPTKPSNQSAPPVVLYIAKDLKNFLVPPCLLGGVA